MIRRITLKDFMSHKNTVIDLDDGVTVLTGPNNIGKSAVVEAIRCVAENPASQELIRHGASKAVVSIELDSGEIITWERTPGYSRYKIFKDGREEIYAKIGNSVPEDVLKLLRISPVVTGDDEEINVHIAPQKDPIFIPSGSKAAGFFAASTEAHYLVKMQQLLKAKADAKKARKKEVEIQILKIRKLIELYEPLDDIEKIFSRVDRLERDIKNFEEAIPKLAGKIYEIENLTEEANFLRNQFEVLGDLLKPPVVKDTAPLEEIIASMSSIISSINMLQKEEAILGHLEYPPELAPTKDLSDIILNISQQERIVRYLYDVNTELGRLTRPPEIHPSKELHGIIVEMEQLERDRQKLFDANLLLSTLKPSPELYPVAELKLLVGEMESAFKEVTLLTRFQEVTEELQPPPDLKSSHEITSLAHLIAELEDMENRVKRGREYYAGIDKACREKRLEIEGKLKEIRICPLCRQPIDAERFLRGSCNTCGF